jgi:hypothetical protein
MEKKRKAYRLLVGKPKKKRPLGRPRRMRVENIKMRPGEREWGKVLLTGLVWLRIWKSGKLL